MSSSRGESNGGKPSSGGNAPRSTAVLDDVSGSGGSMKPGGGQRPQGERPDAFSSLRSLSGQAAFAARVDEEYGSRWKQQSIKGENVAQLPTTMLVAGSDGQMVVIPFGEYAANMPLDDLVVSLPNGAQLEGKREMLKMLIEQR